MFKIKTAARLTIIIMMIVNGNLWLGIMLRMTPDPERELIRSRHDLTQMIALNARAFAETNRYGDFQKLLEDFRNHHSDIVSVGVKDRFSRYRFTVGPHEASWHPNELKTNQYSIDILANGRKWGAVEVNFSPYAGSTGLARHLEYPNSFVLFVSALTGLVSWLAFTQTFKYLDPSKVVPGRVRSALDSLSEGLVLLDRDGNIVHTNQAFADMVRYPVATLIGKPLTYFPWKEAGENGFAGSPWEHSATTRQQVQGAVMQLEIDAEIQKYHVNANPILDAKGQGRGVLVSFDNVTVLEQKKQDLSRMIDTLRQSRDEIKKQNERLKFLASRDPLTKCYNRRSFWELFEHLWSTTPSELLNVMMVDIDHFKSINDNYGHSKGDDVLRETGALLLHLVGEHGLVCRYGGEELAVLLPNIDFDSATAVAEGIHEAFNRCQIGGISVTASIGVSNRQFGAMDAQHLLDQADQCLYTAKHQGRNQVVRFDQVNAGPKVEVDASTKLEMSELKVSYSSAMALLSALSFRDPQAATHSLRLAELCVFIGRKYLDPRMLYLLEVAALLHEVGRVSTRTTVQHDFRPLTPELVGDYQMLLRTSCEVLRSTFSHRNLKQIILGQSDDDRSHSKLPEMVLDDLRECSDILHVCDRFLHQLPMEEELESSQLSALIESTRLSIRNDSQKWWEVLRHQQSELTTILRSANTAQVATDPEATSLLADSVEELCLALSQRDLASLRTLVARLQKEAVRCQSSVVSETILELHTASQTRGVEFDELEQIAERLIGLSRMSRSHVVQTAEAGELNGARNEAPTRDSNIVKTIQLPDLLPGDENPPASTIVLDVD